MKTIEEAASEYADRFYKVIVEGTEIMSTIEELNMFARNDFKAGVEFAQRWIPVDEELPEEGEVVYIIVEHRISDKFVQKRYSIGTCKINAFTGERWVTDNNHGLGRTTHWRKIELT